MFQSRRFCDSYRLGTEEEAAAAGTISIRLVAFWELSELSGVGIISMGLILLLVFLILILVVVLLIACPRLLSLLGSSYPSRVLYYLYKTRVTNERERLNR